MKSIFYLTICEHQTVLAENSVCIHNRMLSDDVLRCSGVLAWNRGNSIMYLNKKIIMSKSLANINIAVYQCIYTRGQWKRACGKSVDKTIRKIVNKFIDTVKEFLSFNNIYQI